MSVAQTRSVIISRENRWLKRFRACLAGDARDDGSVGVEGVRLVEAALGSGLVVEAVLVSASGMRHLPRIENLIEPDSIKPAPRMLSTSDRLFAWMADTHTPQGIAALVRPRTSTVATFLHGVALVTVLIGVQDPGNVGTIVRAAEAFGATGVATCAAGEMGTANPLMPKALRASAGSALRLPIVHGLPAEVLLAQLRAAGVKLYAAVRDSGNATALRPWEVDWKSRAALLIGNEGAGLPDSIVELADAQVSIPQAANFTDGSESAGVESIRIESGRDESGRIESLNAAMAGTVLLYEAMRQRRGHEHPG